MIFCGMLDLCRIIFGIVVDLVRPRAALEAEILVLRRVFGNNWQTQPRTILSTTRNGTRLGLPRRGEQHLRHILKCYMEYYNAVRTHLSLGKDAPIWRDIQCAGRIEVRPVLGGLHHQYVRI